MHTRRREEDEEEGKFTIKSLHYTDDYLRNNDRNANDQFFCKNKIGYDDKKKKKKN